MAIGLRCTADFQTANHPNCSFPFPFFQRLATVGSWQCPHLGADAMSCHSSNEVTGASEMPKFAPSPSQRYDYPQKDFYAFWTRFWVFVEAYTLARPIRPYLYSHFQTSGALGLPMCHIFQVSGSSLPVPIFIGRWIDHINLQAGVTKSGMK